MGTEAPEIDALFCAAIELSSPEERAAYLQRACGQEDDVRHRVEKLLNAHFHAGSFLESPPVAVDVEGTVPLDEPLAERPGTIIGPYKLLQQIGEGGMGVVFMAEQTEPIQRTVALKIIKPGMDTRQVIARFEAERQALAMMDHPNIAKVLDAGTTDSGRPYFVMELVKGVPITKYCDEKQRSIRERLDLLLPICEAVQHAHQKGIIHRDIKPTNVLVAEYDNHAVPKVIDFGVAKATAQKLTERTMFTELGQMVGTMEYMSPEQAKLNQLDIDTRSDIYSLGVLLYELLTGSTPFARKRLQEAAFDEMLRIIREEEPPKPSTRLSTSEGLPSIAANRSLEPLKLNRLVRGELDWIVMKCLEKDRNRRYETASGLAADLQHHLQDEPVQACPPSAAYRFRKFARRNKAAFMAASVIAAALVLGLVGTTWQAIRATDAERVAQVQRDRALQAEKRARDESERANQEAANAKTEAAIATAVNDFLSKDLLAQADPDQEPDREIKLRLVLDRAAEKIETRFPDQPLVEAAIRTTLGITYLSLGEWVEAERHLKRARELHRRELGEEHPETLKSAHNLAWAYTSRGFAEENPQDHDKARQLFEQTLAVRRRVLGEEHLDTLDSVMSLACVFDDLGRLAEGIELMERWFPLVRRTWGDEHDMTLAWMNNQANILRKLGRKYEALRLYQQALEVSRRVRGEEHPSTLLFEDNVAFSLREMGRMDEALKLYVRVVDARRRVLGESHSQTSWSILFMGKDIRRLASAPEGEARAVELVQEIIQSGPTSGAAWTALGMAQYEAGDWRSAIESWEKSMEIRKAGGSIDWFLLSMAHAKLGNADAARKWYDQAAQWMDKNQPNNAWLREFRAEAGAPLGLGAPADRAHRLASRGQWAEASAALAHAIELDPENHRHWYADSVLRLELEDRDGYRHVCRQMLKRFGHTNDPNIAEQTAKTCLLEPDAVSNYEPVVRLADLALVGTQNREDYPWFLLARGMADYRTGNFEAAIERLETVVSDVAEHPYRDGLAYLFLAMTHHQLGRISESQQALAEAIAIEQKLPKFDAADPTNWSDGLRFHIVRREAETLSKLQPTSKDQASAKGD